MGKRKPFEIAFVGLKPGIHDFIYEIEDSFFDENIPREFEHCIAKVKLQLGKADVVCDRCSNVLTKDLWDEFNMVVKMVDSPDEMNEKEEDPDIHYISKTESHLYLNDWIYEFVSLSVPMQKMCSEQEFGGEKCNLAALEKLRTMEVKDNGQNANSIWKGLEQFKKVSKKSK